MDLRAGEFWALTFREFTIKHEAFIRAEDRAEAAMIRQALRLGQFRDKDQRAFVRAAHALKRYPVKRWLLQP